MFKNYKYIIVIHTGLRGDETSSMEYISCWGILGRGQDDEPLFERRFVLRDEILFDFLPTLMVPEI